MDGGNLVDERQGTAEGVYRGSRRLGEVGGVDERVCVVEVLDPAGEGHLWRDRTTEDRSTD